MKQPPAIHHRPCRPAAHTALASRAGECVRQSKRATALWLLYEDCQEGFRPALKYVEDRTGIKANKISEIRKELIDHGLIALTKEKVIIDWERVQTFAALKAPLPKHGRHTYAPVITDDKDWSRVPLRHAPEYQRLRYCNPLRRLEEWEETFFDTLEQLTAEEYRMAVYGMSMDSKLPKEGYITYIPQPNLLTAAEQEHSLNLDAARFDGE